MRRMMVAGNWKMNTTKESATNLAKALADDFSSHVNAVDILVCPPFPYLIAVGALVSGSAVVLGAQNSYFEDAGAFTGEVGNDMLLDIGCQWVILGHSERRHVLGETDELINKKVAAALKTGLKVILCVGETLSERNASQTESVLDMQMEGALSEFDAAAPENLVIAYEPVWAIGTGVTATVEQAETAHVHLRKWLSNRYNFQVADETRILYGGSVKPESATALLQRPDIDGVLVGGASLRAESFSAIVRAGIEVHHS